MDDYNFWADLLDTFQSSPDWIKAVWLLIPPGFLLALTALVLRFRAARKSEAPPNGRLLYSVYRRADGVVRVIDHRSVGERGVVPLPRDIFTDAPENFPPYRPDEPQSPYRLSD